MTKYREILRLYSQGISQRTIAVSLSCSRNTTSKVLKRAVELNVSWPLEKDMTDDKLQELFFPKIEIPPLRKRPDCEYIHKEMARSGVTLSLLWNEYCEKCRLSNDAPLMYSQFCYYYQQYVQKTKATMHVIRKPGEQLEVDWAGQTAGVIDRDTGERMPAYVFVGVLASSGYAYVEAFLSMNLECWITAHVNMYEFFGGVTRILIPDNLKTGVNKPSWYTPVINKTYHELAEHYETAVIPARVRKPKDKPNVEGAVGIISTWIIASLRNQHFFTLNDLNIAFKEKLQNFNSKPFQKKEGSRLSVFLEEEKPMLQSLPAAPYEIATWKVATVQYNYHICAEKMFYSVPYEYIKHKVNVRVTRFIIEVFYHNHRIYSHPRLRGVIGQYSTVVDHMPENHKKYNQWDSERFVSWAKSVGSSCLVVTKGILSSYKVEQQGYRSCMSLLKLADKYSLVRLEAACHKALTYTPSPSCKSIKTILSTGQDKVVEKAIRKNNSNDEYGFTRGAEYYGRDKQ